MHDALYNRTNDFVYYLQAGRVTAIRFPSGVTASVLLASSQWSR